MSVSTHEYTATLLVDGDEHSLSIRRSGTITLDESSAPHVDADLDLSFPDEALQLALDPRQRARVRIDVEADTSAGAQSRTFDLCLRSRPIRRGPGAYASVTLASDEALLEDYKALDDDGTPFTLASSLRAVVNYVLNKAIPGAALEASPAVDSDITPYWPVTNLMPNPAVRSIVGNWIPGGANATLIRETGWGVGVIPGSDPSVTTATFTSWTGDSGLGQGGAFPRTADVVPYAPVREGTVYTVYCWALSNPGKTVRLAAQVFGSDGQVLSGGTPITTVSMAGDTWTLIKGTIRTPANASRLSPFVYAADGTQWTAGQNLRTTKWMIHEGEYPVTVPWFDGATPEDDFYEYVISGDANASATTRTPKVDAADPEALIWAAGESALEFLRPLVQAAGFRLVCDEQRNWTLRDAEYAKPGTISIREGVNLIDGSDVIDLDRGTWFDARVTVYEWEDRDGIRQRKVDSFSLNDPPILVNLVTIEAPYPGPGRSAYAVARAQGRGREVTATVVADWRAHAEQSATIILEGAPTQVGKSSRVTFDLSNDRMTVMTRTSDIPTGSIDLLEGSIDSLTGTIDSL